MQYKVKNTEDIEKYLLFLKNKLQNKSNIKFIKYVKLANRIIRIISFSDEFLPLMEKQLTYTLFDNSDRYDDTLVIWKEESAKNYFNYLIKNDRSLQMRMHLEKILSKVDIEWLDIIVEEYSCINPIIRIELLRGFISAFDCKENIYYYGVPDLSPEEFIKEGHIFVQFFNKIARTSNTNLVHGAVVGVDNKGVLFCARGQRGKSTLAVLSMIRGFEYVSDDYLILEKDKDSLYSYPIYSIITLSPRMYNELYDEIKGKFVSNNARKDKYVFNIAEYHDQFKSKYPIDVCIFPEIVSDPEPSIKLCSPEDKGRAIVQFVQSTVSQVQDINRHDVVKKIYNMIKDKEFYKFNLCSDIERNTIFLKEFMLAWQPNPKNVIDVPNIMVDITFELANIIDLKTFTIFSLNKFATNLFENLVNGVPFDVIMLELSKIVSIAPNLADEFEKFVKIIKENEFIKYNKDPNARISINWDFAKESQFKLSVLKFDSDKTIDLIME